MSIDPKQAVQHFLTAFETIQKEGDPLLQSRKEGIEGLSRTGFPSTKNEEWRFTDLKPFLQVPFQPASVAEADAETRKLVDNYLFNNWDGPQLVFVDGYFREEYSHVPELPAGVTLHSFAAHPGSYESTTEQRKNSADKPFSLLNQAFVQDGVLLDVPANVRMANPVHLISLQGTTGQPKMRTTCNVIRLAKNAAVDIVETVGSGSHTGFNNSVTDIALDANAELNYYRVQDESRSAFLVSNLNVEQERDSRFSAHYVDFGGRLVRNNVEIRLNGQGALATLNGLYSAEGEQHIDNHTVIEHRAANCQSFEQFQGILGGTAHGVFSGMIHVYPDAQKTDAKQSNNCLLLSNTARIDTKPQLEIYADDVKCTHGATVGQLNEDEIFYLRSRGIGLAVARRMLTYAFAEKIIDHIPLAVVNERVESIFVEKFNRQMDQSGK